MEKIAAKLGTSGPVKDLPTPRRVQLLLNGVYIAQTTSAVFIWEHPYYPQLYIPRNAFSSSSSLEISDLRPLYDTSGKHQVATQLSLRVGSKSTEEVISFSSSGLPSPAAALSGLVRVAFDSIDAWFEEDTPIYVHPKDPFKRVDLLDSQRRIRVRVGGQVVADTPTSIHLYETGLPCRFYLPFTSVDPKVLRPSKTRTKCPYKGEAEYYSVEVDGKLHEDVVWYYTRPTLECAKVESKSDIRSRLENDFGWGKC